MADISVIELPDGSKYNIKDANVGITSTYNSTDEEVILTVGSLNDADNTEYWDGKSSNYRTIFNRYSGCH